MAYSITEPLSEHDLEALAELMADNPELADRVANIIATKLDEKFGFRQGEMTAGFEDLKEGQKAIMAKLADHGELLNTMHHNIQDLRSKHDLHGRHLDKIDGRLGKIYGHLGLTTDTRKRA